MIKTQYECDKCGAQSYDKGFLTHIQVKLGRYIGFRMDLSTQEVGLCRDCLLKECGLTLPEKGTQTISAQKQVEEPGVTERLVLALSEFIQEKLQ